MAETIADIVAEKRRRADEIERNCAEKMKRGEMVSDCYARELVADIRREADRLEAALKRERGDAAKLREACANIVDYVQSAMCHATDAHVLDYLTQVEMWAKAALAAPPRNCDVGTVEEQEVRFDGFCMAHKEIKEPGLKGCSDDCPFVMKGFCDLHWAQMPYEEGGAK